jgi:heme/copper-type cytochrome/quinol oxidase subunit 1
MIFFFVTVFLTGVANYFVTLMIGARDMAFPRVNLLGFPETSATPWPPKRLRQVRRLYF